MSKKVQALLTSQARQLAAHHLSSPGSISLFKTILLNRMNVFQLQRYRMGKRKVVMF